MTEEQILKAFPFEDGELVWYLNTEGEFEQVPAEVADARIMVVDVNIGSIDLTLDGKVKDDSPNRIIFHSWERPAIKTVPPIGYDSLGKVILAGDDMLYHFDDDGVLVEEFVCEYYSYGFDEEGTKVFINKADALKHAEALSSWYVDPLPKSMRFVTMRDRAALEIGPITYYTYGDHWWKTESMLHETPTLTPSLKKSNIEDVNPGEWFVTKCEWDWTEPAQINLMVKDLVLVLFPDGRVSEANKDAFDSDEIYKISF